MPEVVTTMWPSATKARLLSRVPMREDVRHDWQANGEARHVGVHLECGFRLENVYVPAGGDIPDRELNVKFGQKLDFIERMTRWSEACKHPTLLVGDFNVAPLECDVWSHKQLLNVVSHTPVEVDALVRMPLDAWLAFLFGERSPGWQDQRRGGFLVDPAQECPSE